MSDFPVELVHRKANPFGHDLITYQEYGGLRRESNLWLPRVGTDGSGQFIAFPNFQSLSPEAVDLLKSDAKDMWNSNDAISVSKENGHSRCPMYPVVFA